MGNLIIDIETDGLLEEATQIHCIAVSNEAGDYQNLYTKETLRDGLKELRDADGLVGHNLQGFDIPVIQKLYPDWRPDGMVFDTLVLSRVAYSNLKEEDWAKGEEDGIPKHLRGRHSLESWGYRLEIPKGEFAKTTDWSQYTDEMGEYCQLDVEITRRLYHHLIPLVPSPALRIEHDFAALIDKQVSNGFCFDVDAAVSLYSELLVLKEGLEEELQSIFPPQEIKMKTYQYWEDPDTGDQYRIKGEAKPAKVRNRLVPGPRKVKQVPFNPGSRVQIAHAFVEKYGWKPKEYTPDGRAKVDETVLGSLEYPEAGILGKYLLVAKRLGQLAEGNEAYLKLEKNGRIYGRVNHNGTVTGRCTHSKPNASQCPSTRSPYGAEFRSLFTVPIGHLLVGVDASQLELRCLAHYMNDSEYIDALISGDIHTTNQEAAGLPTRDLAKVFAYALIYGAGTHKLGSIVGGGMTEGRALRKKFLKSLPAFGRLMEAVRYKAQSIGCLRGLDNRRLPVRSEHKALNTLLQGAGAVIMKVATIEAAREFTRRGWTREDVAQVAHVHDEIQYQAKEDLAEEVGEIAVKAIQDTARILSLRCPLDGEFKTGRTWAETH